ncbi:MAG: UvrD-helicase domain-containing protein [Immundisolibacteraceae bacterium]|nr:UvrD-helicase domain-containing protein [Immundisolibacteraceae bacterium]
MSQPTDFRVREQSLDADGSFTVQAPAGSGKTELLIRRYLTLLNRVEQPEQVLAITFTRKAATEMRARVVEQLHQAEQPSPDDPFQAAGWQLARAVRDRDSELQWGLIEQPSRLRIQTIDSLSQGLNQALPLLAGSGVRLAPSDNPVLLYRQAARELLAGLGADSPCSKELITLLQHLDNRRSQLEDLLVQMLGRRDQWLKALPHPQQFDQFRLQMEMSLERLCVTQLKQWQQQMPGQWLAQLDELANYAADNLAVDKPELAAGLKQPADGLASATVLEQMRYWCAVAQLLLKVDGNPRKTVDKRAGFPAGKGEPQQRKADMVELLIGFTETPKAVAALQALIGLPEPQLSDEDAELIRAMVVVLHYAAAELILVFQARSEGDFAELSLRALQALSDEHGPTDLALALDYKIQHLLVDEFQDTSWLQIQLIALLTAGWQAGDGRTLFLVGDPMQSIYRFREADVGLFLRVREHPIGDLKLEPLTLSANFRSDRSLVEANNRLFAELFPATNDINSGAVSFSASETARVGDDKSNLYCHGFDLEQGRVAEAQRIIELLGEQSDGDAILVRSRPHLVQLLPLLRASGIRFQAVELEPLARNGAVLDLLAIARALLHPADRVGWLALLHGPCVGISLADLTLLLDRSGPRRAVADLLQETLATAELCQQFSESGLQRLVEFNNHYQRLSANLALRLGSRVEQLWLSLSGPALVSGANDLADADRFLNLLDQAQRSGQLLSVEGLQELVAGAYSSSGGLDDSTLQVMTIHKSKGLQFDRVFIPALEKGGRADEAPLLAWEGHSTISSDAEFLLAPIRSSYDKHHPIYQYIQSLEKQRVKQEQLRLLYVGFTRARYQVHLFALLKVDDEGDVREPKSGSLLAPLWPQIGNRFIDSLENRIADDAVEAVPNPDNSPENLLTWRRLKPDWVAPSLPESLGAGRQVDVGGDGEAIEFSWAGETARVIGLVVHRHLCRLSELTDTDWDEYIARTAHLIEHQLAQQGVAATEVAKASGVVLDTLNRAVIDGRGRWILAGGSQNQSEYALTWFRQGRPINLVIDRTFIDGDGCRWIIDYKTGYRSGGDIDGFLDQEQLRYAPQLQRYGEMMQQTGEQRIKMGLYFPRIGGWREWEFG